MAHPLKQPRHNGPCELRPIGEEVAQYACGHEGPRQAVAIFWGEEYPFKDERDPAKTNCPQCLFQETLRTSIRCCLCGTIIMAGTRVAIYYNPDPLVGTPEWGTITRNNNLLGCLFTDCCTSEGFYGGRWTTAGFRGLSEGHTAAQ